MSNFHKGKLKFFKRTAGFGFLEYYIGSEKKSIYTHVSQFKGGIKSVKAGRTYRLTIGQNERGPIAENVEVLKNAKTESNTRTKSNEKI